MEDGTIGGLMEKWIIICNPLKYIKRKILSWYVKAMLIT